MPFRGLYESFVADFQMWRWIAAIQAITHEPNADVSDFRSFVSGQVEFVHACTSLTDRFGYHFQAPADTPTPPTLPYSRKRQKG